VGHGAHGLAEPGNGNHHHFRINHGVALSETENEGRKERRRKKSFTAKDAKDAKGIIMKRRPATEGREGTAPRVAYRERFGIHRFSLVEMF
jgi:hypothetical protein